MGADSRKRPTRKGLTTGTCLLAIMFASGGFG